MWGRDQEKMEKVMSGMTFALLLHGIKMRYFRSEKRGNPGHTVRLSFYLFLRSKKRGQNVKFVHFCAFLCIFGHFLCRENQTKFDDF
jgi:hypothetical protein